MEEQRRDSLRDGRAACTAGPFLFSGPSGTSGAMTDDDNAAAKAQAEEEEVEEAKKVMEELEQGDPPGRLEDWPGGKAKYQTYGGPDSGEGGYEDGATAKLGPSNLRPHEDGSVTIDGEEVDDPDEYKGEPIPGGPSDPDAPPDPAMIGQEKDDEDGGGAGGADRGDTGSDPGGADSGADPDTDSENR
jgi:hypothetical protein